MSVTKLLIANRGEIAIRIARATADLGVPTVAVHSEGDARSLHLRVADTFRALPGQGAAAYLNADAAIAAAIATGCDAIHPPRLRVSGRAWRFCAPVRRGASDLRRARRGASGIVRRKGSHACHGGRGQRAGAAFGRAEVYGVRKADAAMYDAKARGGGFRFWEA